MGPDDGVSAVQWDDIPAPDGMRLMEQFHKSHTRQIGKWRHGDLHYSGTLPVAEVSSYLQERMPQHSWELIGHETDGDGDHEKLSFRRGKDVAECSVVRSTNATTTLMIKVRTAPEKN